VSSAADDAQLNDDHLVQITGESEAVQDTSNLDIISVRITTANQLASVNIADVANPVVVLSAKFDLTFSPNGIAIDANGTLFVSNNMNIPGSNAGAIQTCTGSDGGTIACEPLAITQFISRNLRVNADGIVIDASNNVFLSAYDFSEHELEKRSSWVFKISGDNLDCLENLHYEEDIFLLPRNDLSLDTSRNLLLLPSFYTDSLEVVDLSAAYFGNSVSDLNSLIDADVTALNAFQEFDSSICSSSKPRWTPPLGPGLPPGVHPRVTRQVRHPGVRPRETRPGPPGITWPPETARTATIPMGRSRGGLRQSLPAVPRGRKRRQRRRPR